MKKTFVLLLGAALLMASCASTPAASGSSGPVSASVGAASSLESLDAAAKINAEAAFAQAERDTKNREIKIGTAKGPVSMRGTVLVREYSSGAVIAMRQATDWYAFALVGPVLQLFKEKGVEVLGGPVSDEFPVEGGTQQVFENGVVSVKVGVATWAAAAFVEPAAVAASVGKLNVADDYLGPLPQEKKDLVARAFREAYRLAMIRGFKAGNATDAVHLWDGPLAHVFVKGDSYSVANTWGLPNVAVLLMPSDSRNAYVVKDLFADTYSIGRGQGANSGPFGYGGAVSDEYVKDGFVCQNFEKTLMQSNPDGSVDIIYK